MLIPIYKVDEERRLVIGRAAQEVPDRAGEIMDYETAKPAFKAWSDETFAASGGKSYGNVRAMHGGIAAGRLDAIEFDDVNKSIEVAAHVVDDNEWKKVLEGVYTGFSMGGKYAKRWKDGDLTRYTPSVSEISLVDRPCVPSAQFADIIKADGSVGKLALKGADMADETTIDDVVKDAAAEQVEATDENAEKRDVSTKERDKLAEEGKAMPDGSYPIASREDLKNAIQSVGRAKNKSKVKAHIKARAKALGAEDELPESWSESKKADALADLAKGQEIRDVGIALSVLSALDYLLSCEEEEAEEGMDEPPEQTAAIRSAIASVKAFIVSEIQENHDEGAEEGGEGEPMEMADGGDLAKAGKSISAKNGEHLDAIHKAASDIAMRCAKMMGLEDAMTEADKADGAEDMTKTDGADALAKMAGELDELRKAHDAVTAERDDLLKAKAEWEAKPEPAKGIAKAVTKEEDNHAAPDAVAELQKRIEKMTPEQQAQEIIKFQMQHGGRAFLG